MRTGNRALLALREPFCVSLVKGSHTAPEGKGRLWTVGLYKDKAVLAPGSCGAAQKQRPPHWQQAALHQEGDARGHEDCDWL